MNQPSIFLPVIDNGMGLSRTSWAVSMMALCKSNVFRDRAIDICSVSFPYPDGALNKATNIFMQSGAEEMLIIDTDIIFSPQHVEWLLSHSEPFVAGIYPLKTPGLYFPCKWLTEENPCAVDPHAPEVKPLVEVVHVARGFCRIKREVFETMMYGDGLMIYTDPQSGKESFEYWKTRIGGDSEDFDFCHRYRALGGKVFVDQRVVTQHEGSAVYPIPGTF